ncbi:hypothetical protein [Weissella confusa]|uniref:hypothetical protein n=2 Tax=Weissella confusa TaxID=1583 RepID=UPI0002465B21|nr:hypothetical protein [Weissella confusa]CCF30367.1 Putative uncharacterized protein [Weissella confusa LBAE C39-2]
MSVFKKVLVAALSFAVLMGIGVQVDAAGKTTDLTAGQYTVGSDIKAGRYVVTPLDGTSGNFQSTTGSINVILGDPNQDTVGSMYVSSYTVDLKKKTEFNLSGVNAHFEAVTKRTAIRSGDLHAGVYQVGKDIKPGKYAITAKQGSGNLISTKKGYINEMMGTDSQDGMYVQSYTAKLRKGQIIQTTLELINLQKK